eukprot:9156556-Alexandrium_andersonii.AAC.1
MGLEVPSGQLLGGARTRRLGAVSGGNRMHTRRDLVVERLCVQPECAESPRAIARTPWREAKDRSRRGIAECAMAVGSGRVS